MGTQSLADGAWHLYCSLRAMRRGRRSRRCTCHLVSIPCHHRSLRLLQPTAAARSGSPKANCDGGTVGSARGGAGTAGGIVSELSRRPTLPATRAEISSCHSSRIVSCVVSLT